MHHNDLISKDIQEYRVSGEDAEVILYAIAVGASLDRQDGVNLHRVYEKQLRPLPTFYTLSGWKQPGWLSDVGIVREGIVHVRECLKVHRPLDRGMSLRVKPRIIEIADLGPEKGAVLTSGTSITDDANGTLLAETRSTLLCRRNGGIDGAPPARKSERFGVPDREADEILSWPVRPDQAALYRLCGDWNPIHIDPTSAKALGFDRPLLHGLCTFGAVWAAIEDRSAVGEGSRVTEFEADFLSPVFGGDRLEFRLFADGEAIRFAVVTQAGIHTMRGQVKISA